MENPFIKPNMSAIQIRDLQRRTVVIKPMKQYSQIQIKTYLGSFGKYEVLQFNHEFQTYFVLYETKEQAQKVVEGKNENLLINLDSDRLKEHFRAVTIYNLPVDVSETIVSNSFAQFGTISYVKLIRDYNGEQKGYGYVSYADDSSVQKAIETKEIKIMEKFVQIHKFVEEQEISNLVKEFNNPKKPKSKRNERLKQYREKQRMKKAMKGQEFTFKTNVNENMDVPLDNQIKIPGRIMKKTIKKLKDNNKDLAKGVKKYQDKVKKHLDSTFFAKPSEMKKRRDMRKVKMESNTKKANKLFKPQKKIESIL